jgi:RNA polymerase sporulation-specific sigma factor
MFEALLSGMAAGLLVFILRVTGSGSFPRALSAEQERECLQRLAAGDSDARDQLIAHNLRLVAHIIKKIRLCKQCRPGRSHFHRNDWLN